jgi:peroxiredoxin
MRNFRFIFLILCVSFFASCGSKIERPIYSVAGILLNTDTFWNYYYNTVNLSDDFVGFDESGKLLTRKAFFDQIEGGYYLPVALKTDDSIRHYKLFELKTTVDSELRDFISTSLAKDIKYFKMEGRTLPKFNFTDINGKIYNAQTTKGKIVVLKFWFIGCGACIKEMPALNKMVKKYENRKDIVFLSLADDSSAALRKFLKTTAFSYATTSVPSIYITEEVGITSFPTHLIINKSGKIARVSQTERQLQETLSTQSKL